MARGKQAAADQAPVEGLWDLPDGWRWERLDSVAPVNPAAISMTCQATLN